MRCDQSFSLFEDERDESRSGPASRAAAAARPQMESKSHIPKKHLLNGGGLGSIQNVLIRCDASFDTMVSIPFPEYYFYSFLDTRCFRINLENNNTLLPSLKEKTFFFFHFTFDLNQDFLHTHFVVFLPFAATS